MARLQKPLESFVQTERMLAHLSAHGHKLTKPRRQIAECIAAGKHSMTLDDIVASVNAAGGAKLNLRSAYSNVELFMREDLVHEFLFDNKKHYELVRRSEHMHVIDQDRNVTHWTDVSAEIKRALAEQLAENGFALRDFTIEAHVTAKKGLKR